MTSNIDFDEILPEIGEYGTYQRLVLWFLLVPGVFPCAFQAYNQIFMATVPEHWCQLASLKEQHPNVSNHIIKSLSIPYDNLTKTFDKCSRYDLDFEELFPEFLSEDFEETEEKMSYLHHVQESAKIIPCDTGWHYELEEYTTSIVADWDLVCSREFLPTLSLVLLGLSGLIGSFIFGFIQDTLGRRPAFFIYLVILCFFGFATAYTPSYGWWLGCRIGVGFSIPAIIVTPMVLAIELVGPTYRTYTSVVMNVAYSCSLILLAVIVYFVRIWPQLTLATTIPFLGFFGFWWVLPESPRWLLATGKLDEAFKIMSTMATVNKKPAGKDFISFLIKRENEKEKNTIKIASDTQDAGVLDLFRTPNLRKKTLIITFIWFANTAVYTGLSFYAPSIGGDAYLNFFLAACAELPTYLFLWVAMEYWGRRWTLCFSMVIGGVACIATIISQNDYIATLVLYCIGKFGISASYVVLPLLASELYPTVVRGVGLGLSSTAGMVGPIIIPLINYLGSEMMVLPLIVMGVLLVIGGASSLLLPETLHQPLPQTLEEGENFGKNMRLREYYDCCPRRRLKSVAIDCSKEFLETTNNLPQETDALQPSPEEDFQEESLYPSLRRNSFRKAQSESLTVDDEVKKPLTNLDPPDAVKNRWKKKPKSNGNKNYFKNGPDALIKYSTKVTVI